VLIAGSHGHHAQRSLSLLKHSSDAGRHAAKPSGVATDVDNYPRRTMKIADRILYPVQHQHDEDVEPNVPDASVQAFGFKLGVLRGKVSKPRGHFALQALSLHREFSLLVLTIKHRQLYRCIGLAVYKREHDPRQPELLYCRRLLAVFEAVDDALDRSLVHLEDYETSADSGGGGPGSRLDLRDHRLTIDEPHIYADASTLRFVRIFGNDCFGRDDRKVRLMQLPKHFLEHDVELTIGLRCICLGLILSSYVIPIDASKGGIPVL